MLQDADLEAAVAEGVVTQAQVDAMHALAARRSAITGADRADDERFRFLRGFNDIFFTVGVALFALGVSYFTAHVRFGSALGLVMTWALAEVLIGRLRLVLPGMLLACVFVLFAVALIQSDVLPQLPDEPTRAPQLWRLWALFFGGVGSSLFTLWSAVTAAVAGALFYLRFRLPFTLLLIASAIVVAVLAAVGRWMPGGGATTQYLLLLACGLGVFTTAMWYDLSDRERVTRRSDCAFWLHVLAAPLIVHSLIRLLAPASFLEQGVSSIPPDAIAIVLVTIAVLTIIALLIDRRALFVSGLIYLGIAVGHVINSASGNARIVDTGVLFATLAVLGLLVLGLGLGWRPFRRVSLRLVPATVATRLPPIAAAS
ncbi:MAG: hypothetical protein JO000_17285 [Alphaproteobacteria bacterium]|nr:hypothetical protein [Alphaproteobacteria bacterium]